MNKAEKKRFGIKSQLSAFLDESDYEIFRGVFAETLKIEVNLKDLKVSGEVVHEFIRRFSISERDEQGHIGQWFDVYSWVYVEALYEGQQI